MDTSSKSIPRPLVRTNFILFDEMRIEHLGVLIFHYIKRPIIYIM